MIVPDPEQPRRTFAKQAMEELTASIRARGIKQPLTVRWSVELGRYVIIDGGRRYAASEGIDELPCWVQRTEGSDVLIDQIVHNWQRADLRPYETADALARLRDEHCLSQKELAEATAKPKSEISKLLALHDKIVPEVQSIARDDPQSPLTKRHLYTISKLKPDEQREVAAAVEDRGLTAVQTENLVARRSPGESPKPKRNGIAERQRRFKTSKADVVMTFRRTRFSDEDVRSVVVELLDTLAQSNR